MSRAKIHCANCLHCKEFTHVSDLTGARERRVKCTAGQWATPAGREKTYPLHTVLNRKTYQCDHYESMGEEDLKEYLVDLRNNLPAERIVEMPGDEDSARAARR